MKNKHASALGKRRWKGKTKKEKRDYALMMVAARKKPKDKGKKLSTEDLAS